VLRTLLTSAAALLLMSGCASRGPLEIEIQQRRAFEETTGARTAVLKVSTPESDEAGAPMNVWGTVYPPTARQSFAELLAHHARRTGGMEVVPPSEVDERLSLAGFDPTLSPSDKQLAEFARTLECESYLEAIVQRWRYTYLLTRQKAVVSFTLHCYEPGNPTPLWTARVFHTRRGKSERQVADDALRRVFRRLSEQEEE
jgi:hypothetical protein